jgi:hypothetical protein
MPPEVVMSRPRSLGPFVLVCCCLLLLLPAIGRSPAAQTPAGPTALPAVLSDADVERFLKEAKVVRSRGAGKGITGSLRATLTDGTTTHDAHIQTIDETKREFRSASGTEFNFRDSWSFNVAAYKIDRLLGLKLVPVTVARRWRSTMGAFTWWVDDVQMDEGERLKKKLESPDSQLWNEEMQLVRLFDQLIYNIDRNLGNIVITNDWAIWAIDHTRAFRTYDTLKSPGNISRCDRAVFERLKALDKAALERETGEYLQGWEIDALLKRRNAIVKIIESRGAVGLFDRQRQR